jgi:hypothetical protein
MLDNAGYAVAGPIASVEGAAGQAAAAGIDLVALDVDEFGDRDIERLTVDLGEQRIPCIALGSPGRFAQIKAGVLRVDRRQADRARGVSEGGFNRSRG